MADCCHTPISKQWLSRRVAGGIEVGKDLIELGMPKTTRGPQKPFAAENPRHNLTHISSETWCEVSVSSRDRDAVHRSSRSKKDASIQSPTLITVKAGEPAITSHTLSSLFLLTPPQRCSMLLECRTRSLVISTQLNRWLRSSKTWVALQLSCGPTVSCDCGSVGSSP